MIEIKEIQRKQLYHDTQIFNMIKIADKIIKMIDPSSNLELFNQYMEISKKMDNSIQEVL